MSKNSKTSSGSTANLAFINDLYREIHGDTDRSLVILAAAYADKLLEEILILKLLESTKKDDPLLGRDRPLDTLSARTHAAYRLGCISKLSFDALNILRSLRNDFAHKTGPQNFEDIRHSSKISTLQKLFEPYPFVDEIVTRFIDDGMNKVTASFLASYCVGIHSFLLNAKRLITRVDEHFDTFT